MRIVNSQALSLGLHAAALAILFFLSVHSRSIQLRAVQVRDVVALIVPRRVQTLRSAPERSGGSHETSLPARHGAPPPKATRTFIPPKSSSDPKLPMPITLVFDSPTIQIYTSAIGDPGSRLLEGGLGNQGGPGIGDHSRGQGIGPGPAGPPGISSTTSGRATTPPKLIYQVEPEFSEEARKAKYQGIVLLAIEVDTAGRATNIRVVQGLGLGLDEKAIEAVSKWRFRPGLNNGRPVVTSATVEVNFRLL